MKNSILLIALGIILLTGCSKDDSIEQIEEQTNDIVYVSKQLDGNSTWGTMEINAAPNGILFDGTNNSKGFGFTSGLFTPTYKDLLIISWSGSKDEKGNHGNAEIQMTTPSKSFHFIMETECITVDGNTAMYGGLVTEVVRVSGDPPPFGIYWRFYFKVIDNSDGGQMGNDQISSMRIFASPRSMSLCDVYPPNHPIWSSQGYEEVHEPGFVVVDAD